MNKIIYYGLQDKGGKSKKRKNEMTVILTVHTSRDGNVCNMIIKQCT